MTTARSQIGELEQAIRSGSKEQRLDTLRRITDLFLVTSGRLTDDQIEVFGDVLGHLVNRIEARALAEISERLAPIENAPIGVIRTLAQNDEIAVAGPVLTLSELLSGVDLVEIARTKGQAHLLAISGRKQLPPTITDVLVERGNRNVHRKLATSQGAQFSDETMARLVKSARFDEPLTESLGLRRDLPPHLFRQLLETASRTVCDKLLAIAPAGHQEEIRNILAGIGKDALDELPEPFDFDRATLMVRRMHEHDQLDEFTLLQFAQSSHYAEMIAALSIMCAAPCELLHQIFQSERHEAFIIPCRAAGLSWPTICAIAKTRPNNGLISERELARLRSDYSRLSVVTARRVVRFWCVQRVAGKEFHLV